MLQKITQRLSRQNTVRVVDLNSSVFHSSKSQIDKERIGESWNQNQNQNQNQWNGEFEKEKEKEKEKTGKSPRRKHSARKEFLNFTNVDADPFARLRVNQFQGVQAGNENDFKFERL